VARGRYGLALCVCVDKTEWWHSTGHGEVAGNLGVVLGGSGSFLPGPIGRAARRTTRRRIIL